MSDNADRSVYDKVIRAMLDEPVTLVLTNEEVSKLMLFISELTLGPYSPTEEEWKQMENVHGLSSADYYLNISKKLGRYLDNTTSPSDK
ncbi:MAG: hypothetical protein HXL00_00880 [Candidatus Nanosynbacter sp.]|nr:hypothetical protein [Candidatus Nanosynbacter sp.]